MTKYDTFQFTMSAENLCNEKTEVDAGNESDIMLSLNAISVNSSLGWRLQPFKSIFCLLLGIQNLLFFIRPADILWLLPDTKISR